MVWVPAQLSHSLSWWCQANSWAVLAPEFLMFKMLHYDVRSLYVSIKTINSPRFTGGIKQTSNKNKMFTRGISSNKNSFLIGTRYSYPTSRLKLGFLVHRLHRKTSALWSLCASGHKLGSCSRCSQARALSCNWGSGSASILHDGSLITITLSKPRDHVLVSSFQHKSHHTGG